MDAPVIADLENSVLCHLCPLPEVTETGTIETTKEVFKTYFNKVMQLLI